MTILQLIDYLSNEIPQEHLDLNIGYIDISGGIEKEDLNPRFEGQWGHYEFILTN